MSAAASAALERPRIGNSNTVFKSGHLLISFKGLGWRSWKKRWFILTRTSLVFFKNDPSALPQRGGEINLTLGGIDLNNSGSVVVREDKKLLTVLFPDGRDGRAFTLKAETSEDLFEWKIALENALAQAPNAALVMGRNGIFRNDTNDSTEGSFHQWRERRPVKSLVVGRPILLALEDIDGGPSFLEKALRFLEKHAMLSNDGRPISGLIWKILSYLKKMASAYILYLMGPWHGGCLPKCHSQIVKDGGYDDAIWPNGIKVEGILRQSADVEEVERRVQEYEQGKTEFDPNEDAHVIGDCVKHVLRELPSSPVPASCCTALLEAFKIDQMEARVNAMRTAIHESFPEPNRRLLQRVLKMMHTISSHASENRMTQSAVAICMAPLLLRPLLAGECELEDDYDANGDNSAQLIAATYAANNAQAIITMLLEEYDNIFDDDILHRCSMSVDSQTDNSATEDSSDDENPKIKVSGYHDAQNEADHEANFNSDCSHTGKLSESSGSAASDLYDFKAIASDDSDDGSPTHTRLSVETKLNPRARNDSVVSLNDQLNTRQNETHTSAKVLRNESQRSMGEILSSMNQELHQSFPGPELLAEKAIPKPNNTNISSSKKSTFWGKRNARKSPSSESVDYSGEEELAIQRLEIAKNDLRQRIAKEARGNAILQASLERRKQALHERRLTLEQDVARLQEQLQAERDLRAALEVGLSMSSGQFSGSRGMDTKTRAELEEIALAEADVARLKQKVAELHHQLNQQCQHHYGPLPDASDRYQHPANQSSQQKYFQQDFDTTLAVCNNERKQRTEESLGIDVRNIKGQLSTSGTNSRLPPWKQLFQSASMSDSKSTEASTSLSVDNAVDSASLASTSRAAEAMMDYPRHPSAASSTLVELTTRLDFFKERRSQLMEQLQNLDLNFGSTTHQDFVHKPSSTPWI